MNTFLINIKKPFVYIPLAIVVIAGAGYAVSSNNKKSDSSTATLATTTEQNIVKISGHVRAAQDVDLSIKRGGRITAIHYKVGEKVPVGAVIVETDAADLYASLSQAKSTYEKEAVKLEELTTSARPEEIAIAQSQKDSAQADYVQKFISAYNAIDDAVRNTTDQFINSPTSASAQLNIPVTDQDLGRDITRTRYDLETDLKALQKIVPAGDATDVSASTYTQFSTTLSKVSVYLGKFAAAVNSLTANAVTSQSTISGWKTSIANARTSVTNASQNLTSAKSALAVATNELTIKQTGGSDTEIKAQQAVVLGAQAQMANISAQISDTLIKAPFSGILTRQDADLGQTIAANTNLASLISEGAYEVEAYVPEVNVSKITVGDKATITLDAFGPQPVFNAEVISLDLSEKSIDGVPSYKVKLRFLTGDDRIKSGMTANVTVSVSNSK